MAESRTQTGKSRVTSISMKRVHNLGNYENIQYEVTVEIGEKDDPGKVVSALEGILEDVQAKSPVQDYQLRSAREALAKPRKGMSSAEKERLPFYREQIKKHEAVMKRREKARAALATLSYTSVRNDAKLDWDDYDQGDDF